MHVSHGHDVSKGHYLPNFKFLFVTSMLLLKNGVEVPMPIFQSYILLLMFQGDSMMLSYFKHTYEFYYRFYHTIVDIHLWTTLKSMSRCPMPLEKGVKTWKYCETKSMEVFYTLLL